MPKSCQNLVCQKRRRKIFIHNSTKKDTIRQKNSCIKPRLQLKMCYNKTIKKEPTYLSSVLPKM